MVTFNGQEMKLSGKMLQKGQRAPDFVLAANDLSKKSLKDFPGKKMISVVPSLDTGVCDRQTRRFNQEVNQLGDASVITVSVDLPFAQARWCAAAGLDRAVTLSDYLDRSFGKAYGLYMEELGLLARAVFVLNSNNEVVYLEYVPEVTQHPDYEKALQAIKEAQ